MLRCAITNGLLRPCGWGNSIKRLRRRCTALKKDGVSFLIVREKQLDVRELLELTRGILGVGMKVLIARRVDVAIAAGAAGVHLSGGAGELTPGQVREVMPGAFVSVSCHEVEEVRRARMGGADLILFAPVFGKSVGGEMVVGGVGLEKLREACVAAEGIPVLALGGVTAENASECVKVGAAGVAGIRMFFE
jgi:thiamine-phosphate pyrophosphorylase